MKKSTIITLTGPSASGKSTLERALCAHYDSPFRRVLSTTTRAPRAGEINGRDYHFISHDEFAKMEVAGEFVEVVRFGLESYGATSKEFGDIFASGHIAVIVVEPNGFVEIRKFAERNGHHLLSVFIDGPAVTRYARLIDRFVADLMSSLTPDKVKDAFARRLAIVESVESLWRSQDLPFDLHFGNFDDQNRQAVVNAVASTALQLASGELVRVGNGLGGVFAKAR